MALLQTLRSLVNERLSAAAEEIFRTVGQIVAAYEGEAWTLKQEIDRQRRLLDMVSKPYTKLHRSDIVYLPTCKDGVYREQRMNFSSAQDEPQPTEIKEEQLIIPGGGLTPLAVKHACGGENREIETATITTPGHLKPQAEVEVVVGCVTPQPTSDDEHSLNYSASDTEDIDEWEETNRSDLNTMKSHKAHFSSKVSGKMTDGNLKMYNSKRPLRCGACGKDFFKVSSLKSHMLTHTGERPFTCTVCGKGFRTQTQLKVHMMTHTGERPSTCTLCGKGFVHSGNLKTHMLTHTDVREFTCPVCGKGFKTEHQLKLHMMVHTGERPFTCTVCGKGFRVRGNLKSHMMTHTGERPFSCTVCGREFVTKNSFKRHLKNFH